MDQIKQIEADSQVQINEIKDLQGLESLKKKILGKNGIVSDYLKNIRSLSQEERKDIGSLINGLKDNLAKLIDGKRSELEKNALEEKMKKEAVELSLCSHNWLDKYKAGSFHPVYQIQREVEDIFLSMGFNILDGPHIEDDWHNFGALNIDPHHPARDMQDTFWFKGMSHLLRTHTSSIQARGMRAHKPPFRFIAPGKVFRCERTDATHEMCFHQLEGMMVGENITVGNLIYFMKTLLREIFKRDVEVRLRPGFFPFVEPGFELDIRWKQPNVEAGESKFGGWLELLPCGMIHPNVLEAGGIDSSKYNGFAFGLGLDRLVMVKYGIDDIRHLHSGDLRFNKQFGV